NLKEQLESLKLKQEKELENQHQYYANPANLFIPRGFTFAPIVPQNDMLDVYLDEVKKLREEINSLKQVKMTEPTAQPEVFEENITEITANPKVVEEDAIEEVKATPEQLQFEEEVHENQEAVEEIIE